MIINYQQQVGRLVDQVDRIADAALRTARTDQARQKVHAIKQDLTTFKIALKPTTPVVENKPGTGKNPGAVIILGVVITAETVAYLMLLVCAFLLYIYIVMSWDDIVGSAQEFQYELLETWTGLALTYEDLLRRLIDLPEVPDPCGPSFDRILAILGRLRRFARRQVWINISRRDLDEISALVTELGDLLDRFIQCMESSGATGTYTQLFRRMGVSITRETIVPVIRVVINQINRIYLRIQPPGGGSVSP